MRKIALTVVATGLMACGGGLVCTEMGCNGVLALQLGAPGEAAWTVTVEGGDLGTVTCTFDPADLPEGFESPCDGDPGASVALLDGEVVLRLTGGFMQEAPPADAITVEMVEGGDVIASADLDPAWTGPVYPNGARCDAPNGCWSAEVDVPRT